MHRETASQVLQHKWVTGSDVATVQLTSALEELRRFNARRKFKAAVSTVQATISLSRNFSNRSANAAEIETNKVENVNAEIEASGKE